MLAIGNPVNKNTSSAMNNLKAPSLHSLLESDHGSSNDSLLAESLQLDIEEVGSAAAIKDKSVCRCSNIMGVYFR